MLDTSTMMSSLADESSTQSFRDHLATTSSNTNTVTTAGTGISRHNNNTRSASSLRTSTQKISPTNKASNMASRMMQRSKRSGGNPSTSAADSLRSESMRLSDLGDLLGDSQATSNRSGSPSKGAHQHNGLPNANSTSTSEFLIPKKIEKVLRSLDPTLSTSHRGRDRSTRLSKFRHFVDGAYTGGIPPVFSEGHVRALFLGARLDKKQGGLVPGLLRACGTPSTQHGVLAEDGRATMLLKKSAVGAIELVRYLVCDLSSRGELGASRNNGSNANGGGEEENDGADDVFSRIFASLPVTELRQLRLPLHLESSGENKREGSKTDASQLLTHYLLYRTDTSGATNRSPLDDLGIAKSSDARASYNEWVGRQSQPLRDRMKRMGYYEEALAPACGSAGERGRGLARNRGSVMTLRRMRSKSPNPLEFARDLVVDDPNLDDSDSEDGTNVADQGDLLSVAAFGPNSATNSSGKPLDSSTSVRELRRASTDSDDIPSVPSHSSNRRGSQQRENWGADGSYHGSLKEFDMPLNDGDGDLNGNKVSISVKEFAALKSELTFSRNDVEMLRGRVKKLEAEVDELRHGREMDRRDRFEEQSIKEQIEQRQNRAEDEGGAQNQNSISNLSGISSNAGMEDLVNRLCGKCNDMQSQINSLLLTQNEMKSKMGMMKISRGGSSRGGSTRRSSQETSTNLRSSDNGMASNRRTQASHFDSMRQSMRVVFSEKLGNERSNATNTADDKDSDSEDDEVSPESLLWDEYEAPVHLVDDFVPPVYPKTDEEVTFINKALGDSFIFSQLGTKERCILIDAFEPFEVSPGETIIKQGDTGDYYYIINEGTVQYVIDGNIVGDAGPGETFGEMSMLNNSPRTATVNTITKCRLFRVAQNAIKSNQ